MIPVYGRGFFVSCSLMQEPAKRFRHIMYIPTPTERRQIRIRKFLSDCDKITPTLHPLERLSKANEFVAELEKDLIELPSRFKPKDAVEVCLADAGRIKNCTVIKVHFTESKVLYDVEVWGHFQKEDGTYHSEEEQTWSTRLYNIDSAFIEEGKL